MTSKSGSSGIRSFGSQLWTLAEEAALISWMRDAESSHFEQLLLKVWVLNLSWVLLEVSSISCGKDSSLIYLWVWEWWWHSQSTHSWASRQVHLLCCRSLWTWHLTWECSWNSWQAFGWKHQHGKARSSDPASGRDDSLASGKVVIPTTSWYSVELWLLFHLPAYTAFLHSLRPWAAFVYSMRTD